MAGGRPSNEELAKKKEWESKTQVNSNKLNVFLYQDTAQSNNPITIETLMDLKTAFLIGATLVEACQYAGITRPGYSYWLKHMPNDLRERWEFLVEKWQNDVILQARQTIRNNIGDPNTSKWLLERKRRDEFATRTEQELKKVEKFSDVSDEALDDMIGAVNGDSK